jgi:hypothetical protein
MKKTFFTLMALSAACFAFGQSPTDTGVSLLRDSITGEIHAGKLDVRRNSVYSIGGSEVSLEQALSYAAPFDNVVKNIKLGYKTGQLAGKVANIGGITIGAGLTLITVPLFGEDDSPDGGFFYVATGGGLVCLGVLGCLSALTINICSTVYHRKAIRLFNEQTGYSSLCQRPEVVLSMGATSGGMGLQLSF